MTWSVGEAAQQYEYADLVRLQRIVAFRSLGVGLDEIQDLVGVRASMVASGRPIGRNLFFGASLDSILWGVLNLLAVGPTTVGRFVGYSARLVVLPSDGAIV